MSVKSIYATEGYCIGCWIRPIICSLGAVLPDVNTREVVTKYAVCDCGNDLGRLHPLTTDYSKHFGYDPKQILNLEFFKVSPSSERPCGKLYAYWGKTMSLNAAALPRPPDAPATASLRFRISKSFNIIPAATVDALKGYPDRTERASRRIKQ
jgi:hypothetical protein